MRHDDPAVSLANLVRHMQTLTREKRLQLCAEQIAVATSDAARAFWRALHDTIKEKP